MKAHDLALALTPGQPAISPDGRRAVVAVTRVDLDADDYPSQLWLVDTDGAGVPRRLTTGWRDSNPQWSPDGAWIAFVRAERGPDKKVGKPQLWALPTGGGEPRRLTGHPLGAGAPVWSPDSTRLAYLARVPEQGRYGSVEGSGPESEAPRRITSLMYRLDGLGFLDARRSQVFVVDLAAADELIPADATLAVGQPGADPAGGADDPVGGPVQVTSGDYDHESVDWSPAGDLLTFAAARHATAGSDLRNDVFVCAPDGTGLRALTDGGLGVGNTVFSADGTLVCFTGTEITRASATRNDSLWAVPVDGSAPAHRLTDEQTCHLSSPGGRIRPVPDGVLFPNERRGAAELLLVPYDGGTPRVLIDGQRIVTGAASAGDVLVATVVDPSSWGELIAIHGTGPERVLTSFGASFAAVDVRPMREIETTAPDGYPVHGWVVTPAGEGPHPVLLMIHGGPFTQYGWRLFDEAQVYAGAGYAVVMGNPRGSSGYGQAHGEAILGNVGEVSSVDLLALLDAALASAELDPGRVGVLGGSHGGYMTTWLAAHHGDRFTAAISERAVNAIDSFTGSSDIGWFFADHLYGPDPEGQRTQSPLTYADKIDMPMLIIHSEQDWRCPVEQAQRLYVTLRRRGVPAELLLFPGEGHELSRSGLPSHRLARFEAILDWWGRYL